MKHKMLLKDLVAWRQSWAMVSSMYLAQSAKLLLRSLSRLVFLRVSPLTLLGMKSRH